MPATLTITPNTADASFSITAGSLSGITSLSLTRNDPDGSSSPVRSATNVVTGGATTLAFFDYEAPLDSTVSYTLTPNTGSPVTSATSSIVTDGQTYWLKNVAQETLSRKVEVADMSAVVRPARILATYPVLGRKNPVVISDVRSGRVGMMKLNTYTATEAADLRELFAMGLPLLFQAPALTGFADMYFVAGDLAEIWPGSALSPERRWEIPFTEVDSPTDDLVAIGNNSWAKVAQFGTGSRLLAKRTSWLDVLNRPFTQADA
ncbi:hypothetical protein [Dactylosporangium sp. CA-139066]|uniref:hypothetical protein n=1 Tax=Dactylosporangium sp. CA-139066 TaxID=3239930 RepID=UPI003D8A3453